jgi:hypothetical protein
MDKKEIEKFLRVPVVIEEKIDGANLGISVGERKAVWPNLIDRLFCNSPLIAYLFSSMDFFSCIFFFSYLFMLLFLCLFLMPLDDERLRIGLPESLQAYQLRKRCTMEGLGRLGEADAWPVGGSGFDDRSMLRVVCFVQLVCSFSFSKVFLWKVTSVLLLSWFLIFCSPPPFLCSPTTYILSYLFLVCLLL